MSLDSEVTGVDPHLACTNCHRPYEGIVDFPRIEILDVEIGGLSEFYANRNSYSQRLEKGVWFSEQRRFFKKILQKAMSQKGEFSHEGFVYFMQDVDTITFTKDLIEEVKEIYDDRAVQEYLENLSTSKGKIVDPKKLISDEIWLIRDARSLSLDLFEYDPVGDVRKTGVSTSYELGIVPMTSSTCMKPIPRIDLATVAYRGLPN